MKLTDNRFILKYLLLYIVVFSAMLLLLLAVRSKVYSTTFDMLISDETAQLQVNTEQFETNITAFQAASSLIRKNDSYNNIAGLSNVSYTESYDLKKLQEELQQFVIMYDDTVSGAYVFFYEK